MAENRTFTLVGKFDDQITPSLKKLNRTFAAFEKTLNRGMGRSFRDLNKDLRSFAKDLDSIGDIFDRKASRGLNRFRDGIKAANEDARLLGKTLGDASQVGDNFGAGMKDGIRAAQGEAKVLGDILKANALIQVGQGVSNALGAGASSTLGVLQKGAGFFAKQFKAAVQDELEDMQARGSLYGALTKQGVFKGQTAKEQTRDYRQTKRISRINEEVIGNIVRESPVSTASVSTLNRQLTDNLLPLMLKSRGINNLGTQSDAELEKTFKGTKEQPGVGVELAKLYEQMASLMPSPQYARMGAMGFTQAITSGTINRQLAIFEGNPVLVEALKTIDGGIQATSDIGKRVQIIKKALEVAAPTMMLDEMRMSVAGGLQAVQDTLTNPNVGILSMAMEVAGQGEKTLQDFGKINGKIVKGSAYELKLADLRKKQVERLGPKENWNASHKAKALEEEKAFIEKLDDILLNANSPLERIAVSLAPVLQSVSGVLNAMGSIFMGPVNGAMKVLDKVFAQLTINMDNLASDLRKKTRTVPEAFGRMLGEIFKGLAQLFDPTAVGKEAGTAIDKMFADFKKGFDSIDGSKWMKQVVDGLNNIIMRLLFNEGDIMKGVTPLGDGLARIFLLLSAPAFISALISGLVPVALLSMGSLTKAVFGLLTKKVTGAPIAPQGARAGTSRLGALFAGQAAASAAAGSKLPGVARLSQAATGVKMKGVATLAAGMITLATHAPKLRAAGKAVMSLGKSLPLLSIAFAGLDFAAQKAGGKSTTQAGLSAGGGLIGGVAGAAVGQALIPIPGVGAVAGGALGSVIGSWIGANLTPAIQAIPGLLSNAWKGFQVWIENLPMNLGYAIGAARANMESAWKRFTQWFNNLGVEFRAAANRLGWQFKGAWEQFKKVVAQILTGKFDWAGLASRLTSTIWNIIKGGIDGIKNLASGLGDWFSGLGKGMEAGYRETQGGYRSTATRERQSQSSLDIFDVSNWNNKPKPNPNTKNEGWPLSHYSTKNWGEGCSIGSLGGGRAGSVDAFNSVASAKGLRLTSGYRPGSKGWHGINRARDYSNGYSPTPQMLAFATHMAQTYGANLRELIYTPLGFSIKNGQKVPPYAAAGHYNHVHVAYAMGAGTPAFFSSQREAMAWENKATLGNVKVSSITSNSSEGMGAGVTVNAPITIHQQPGQNSEQLASLVAMELTNAIRQARSSSMYV